LIRIPIPTRTKTYDVLIEQGVLRSAASHIRTTLPKARHFVVVTSEPIRRHWAQPLLDSFASDPAFAAGDARVDVIEMPDGERRKNLSTIENLSDQLLKLKADRNTVLIALGGGVVGDVTGFLAGIYMRGIRFVQVPTTFLSQVDSSVGGKTGVNLKGGKNLVGVFKQPELVLADPNVLTTLPGREFRSGLYESLKAGVIRNPAIFDFMEQNREQVLAKDTSALEWLIAESVRVKADVVGEDEEEHGVRKILNFGHTIGHALEAETGYKYFLHGEAVAWGMIAASNISAAMQRLSPHAAQRILRLTLAYAPLPPVEVRPKAIFRRLASDKKTLDGQVHFILPRNIGEVEIATDVSERAVLHAVEELRTLSREPVRAAEPIGADPR
jgi:3-dehydroquinate synthase